MLKIQTYNDFKQKVKDRVNESINVGLNEPEKASVTNLLSLTTTSYMMSPDYVMDAQDYKNYIKR